MTFRLHLYRVHAQKRKQCWLSQYRGNIASQNCKCPFTFCEYQCSNRHDFVQHLKVHLNDGHVVTCPFSNCTGVFRVASSFTSHLSRKHKVADEQSLKPEYQEASASAANEAVRPVPSAGSSVDVSDHESELPANLDSSDDNDTDETSDSEESFLQYLSLFMMKLEAKLLLPVSTINAIMQDMQFILSFQNSKRLLCLKEKLLTLGVSKENITEIEDHIW